MNTFEVVKKQRNFFETGITKDINYRFLALCAIKNAIIENEKEIFEAIKKDLGKSDFESFMTEVGMMLSEIKFLKKHLKKLSKPKKVKTPLSQFPSKSYIISEPFGVVLIMSPWNYPFLLTLEPLVAAIAAGNTAVLKPSAYSPNTSKLISKILGDIFDEEFIAVVEGGREVNVDLLENKFDYIFFTGGKTVGKLVMQKAAENLTPVTLELGGKCPVIVDKTADLKISAKRIVFGKFLNLGQTCVAPDYLLVDEVIKDELLKYIKEEIVKQFGEQALLNESYGKIISEKHFKRIIALIEGENAFVGGKNDGISRIEPTVLCDITLKSPVMGEEIFGPVLPVITYKTIEQAENIIRENPTPLALYLFTKDKSVKSRIMKNISFGGGCVNDTIIHLATSDMPFGGVGQSGIGSYHGKYGFDTFSHKKSIVQKSMLIDLPVRYQPYSEEKMRILRYFLK